MTITQTVKIRASHRITLEVPREVPVGATARLELAWFPRKEPDSSLDDALEKIWALCKDAAISVDSFREERRRDTELEETRYQRFFSRAGDGA
jgi:hypothetical protein